MTDRSSLSSMAVGGNLIRSDAGTFFSSEDFEHAAARTLPRFVHDFIAGGAGNETVIRRNVDGFRNTLLTPRVGINTVEIDTTVEYFGVRYAAPLPKDTASKST